jgi:hypothetical protein
MNRTTKGLVAGLAVLGAACGSARGAIDADALSLTAYAAWGEARTQARGWASDAELQYVEGASVTHQGTVRSDAGYWRFVYGADSRAQQLVVTVTPTSVDGEERTPQGPPGFVLGDATLGSDWIDSPRVIEALDEFGAETRVHMFLVPTTPPRWIVGDVELDARTGVILD